MAQLYFKRSKIFLHGSKNFKASAGTGPIGVPHWVLESETYKTGIADGSIVNMTAKAVEQEAAYAAEEPADKAVEENEEQAETEVKPPAGLVNGGNKKVKK